MKKLLFYFLTFSALIFTLACEKESKEPADNTIDSFDDGVIVTCEGSFGAGNASVYFIDPMKSLYVPNIYQLANQEAVGDVLQSITFEDDLAYLVVNNSGKILVVDEETFEKEGTIQGFSSPTEIEIKDGKGYIGSLYEKHIYVADISNYNIVDSIFTGVTSDRILEEDGHLFALSRTEYLGRVKDHLYTISLDNKKVDSISIGSNPIDWTFNDDDDRIYVYCQGKEGMDPPSIYTINTSTRAVEQHIELPGDGAYFSKIAYDEFNDRVLFSQPTGIHTYFPATNKFDDTPIVDFNEIDFLYALGIHPDNGDIYTGDAIDFNQGGAIRIYNSAGEPVTGIKVGVGPNNFYFD